MSANIVQIPWYSGPRLVQIYTSFSGVHPASILAQQCGREPKVFTRTYSGIKPGYDRAPYGPRITPTQLSMDPAAPRHGVLLSILLQSQLHIPPLPSVGCLLDVDSPLSIRAPGSRILTPRTKSSTKDPGKRRRTKELYSFPSENPILNRSAQ